MKVLFRLSDRNKKEGKQEKVVRGKKSTGRK